MTLLTSAYLESGDLSEFGTTSIGAGETLQTSSTVAQTGTYSLQFTGAQTGFTDRNTYARLTWTYPTNEVVAVTFGLYIPSGNASSNFGAAAANSNHLVELSDASGNEILRIARGSQATSVDQLALRYISQAGTDTQLGATQQAGTQFSVDAWVMHRVEIDKSGANPVLTWWMDTGSGWTRIATVTDSSSGSSGLALDAARAEFGFLFNGVNWQNTNFTWYFDDIEVTDTAMEVVTLAASADDAWEDGSGTVDVTGTAMGNPLDQTDEWAFMRFAVPRIASGNTVTDAYLRLTLPSSGADEPLNDIYCEDVDSSAAATTTTNDLSSRTRTTASANWDNTNLGAPGTFDTPSLVSPVQEVINRGGWSAGNYLGFLIQGSSDSARDLQIRSYDHGGGHPQFIIEWVPGSSSGGGATEVADTDTQAIDETETSAVAATLGRTDLQTLGSTESASIAVAFSRSDAQAIDETEAASLNATLSRSDSQALGLSESSAISEAASLADADTQALAVTETAAVVATLVRADTQAVDEAETSALAAAVTTADTQSVDASESSAVSSAANIAGTDSQALDVSETAAVAVGHSRSDAQDLALSETAAVSATLATADTQALDLTENASLGGDGQITGNDTQALSISETAAVSVTLTTTDTQEIQITEAPALAVAFSRTDTQALDVSESSGVSTADTVSDADTQALSVTETATVTVRVTAADAQDLVLSETVASAATLTDADAQDLVISETAVIGLDRSSADTGAIGVTENATVQEIDAYQGGFVEGGVGILSTVAGSSGVSGLVASVSGVTGRVERG